MTGLQTVPCHLAGMRSGIVLLEENYVFYNSPRDRLYMRLKEFIALACKCAPN